jgi:outer membrane protein
MTPGTGHRLSVTAVRCIAVCALLLPLACPLRAAAGDEFFVSLAGRVGVTPYKRYETQWTPLPMVGYEGAYVYVRGYSAGIKLMDFESLEISAFAGYDGTDFHASDSSDKRLRKLSDRYSGVEAGLEARLLTRYGILHASGAADVSGHSNGFRGTIEYISALEYGNLELIPVLGLQWSSGGYNDYYYGVSDKESGRSGLKDYSAGSGVSPCVGLTIDYSVTGAWEVFGNGELVFLNSAVRDSPMVDRKTTYSLTLGISYTF